MKQNNKGHKPNKINTEQEAELKNILRNRDNGFVGYIELQVWFNETYNMKIEYNTFRNLLLENLSVK